MITWGELTGRWVVSHFGEQNTGILIRKLVGMKTGMGANPSISCFCVCSMCYFSPDITLSFPLRELPFQLWSLCGWVGFSSTGRGWEPAWVTGCCVSWPWLFQGWTNDQSLSLEPVSISPWALAGCNGEKLSFHWVAKLVGCRFRGAAIHGCDQLGSLPSREVHTKESRQRDKDRILLA